MVSGLETLTSGDVFSGGERANDQEPMDRDITMVFGSALSEHVGASEHGIWAQE